MTMKPTCLSCEFCDEASPATRLMPQSGNGGKTVDYVRACDNHAFGWWDGADWDGQALERTIEASAVSPALLIAQSYRTAMLNGTGVLVRNPFLVFNQMTQQSEVVYCVYDMQSGAKGRHFHGHYFERALSDFSS